MCEYCKSEYMGNSDSAFEIELMGNPNVSPRDIFFNNSSGEAANNFIVETDACGFNPLSENNQMYEVNKISDYFSISSAWLGINETEDGGNLEFTLSTMGDGINDISGSLNIRILYCPMCGRRLGRRKE